MNNRSTANAFVHFGGEVISNVESSHGVQLGGGSTGGTITAFGDDANIALTIRAKGSGIVTVGDSSNGSAMAGSTLSITAGSSITISGPISITSSAATINSTRVFFGNGSTTPISQVQRFFVEYTVPVLAAGASAVSSVTVTGLTTNSVLVLQPRLVQNTTVTGVWSFARCSTADELIVEIHNNSASTLSGSTVSAYLLQFKF